MILLENKTAVITGGGQGLGLAMARAFVAEGTRVVLGDLDGAKAKEAAASLGGEDVAVGVECDVVDASAVNFIDFTGVETLGNLAEELQDAGVDMHLAEMRGPVHDVLERAAWFRALEAAGRVHPSVHHAVAELPVRLGPAAGDR